MTTPNPKSKPKYFPPPDLIPEAERREQENNNNRSIDVLQYKPGKHRRKIESSKRRQWSTKRRVSCLGWIFCFPLFCIGYLLREPPVDQDDMEDDWCLPCWE